ncbi:MAG: gliding motility-associated C-terminal domain-containing protein, partial [Bacteroidota bacterium]|nr:gliding motility-associated C-terminal domain-containing protein [Bacteroidota bacterium]
NDSFSYSLTDADGDVSNATVFIHVIKANDVPKPATHQLSTYEGVPLNGNLSLDDISSTDGGNVWILVANAQHGKAEVQSDGNFTYTPQTQYVGADSFTYTITDSNGDAATGIVSITIKACSLEISSVTQSIPTCFGTGNGTLNVNITGGETPIRYSIDGGMNYSNTNQFNSLSAGNYTVLVSDGVGCKVQKDVFLSEPPKIGLDVTIDTMCCGQDANVILMATGGTGNLQYSTDNLTFESINKFKLKPGSYMISVKDQLGCSIEKQIVVPTTTGLEFYNLLTPNGDGRNDVWRIRGIERCRDNEVVIVNRWGEEVRRFRQYNNKTVVWDGTNKNNQKLPDGTYYYIVEIYGIQKKYTGWILLQGNR